MNTSLFDSHRRTDSSGGRRSESEFAFLNRSTWKCAQSARDVLELWFAKLPQGKKAGIRGGFRGNDGEHASALMELTTHEILLSVAQNVIVEPKLNKGRPDFAADFGGAQFIVECIVARESDKQFGALRREKVVMDVVNSVDSGPFRLVIQPRRIGETQPSGRCLRHFLESKLAPLVSRSSRENYRSGDRLEPIRWQFQGWDLQFEAIFLGHSSDSGAIGVSINPLQPVVNDRIISRALKSKAEKYRDPQVPYLIVVSERNTPAEPTVILDVLFGPLRTFLRSDGSATEARSYDGFWGSQSQPKNRHVSAVLYKRRMKYVWSICGEGFSHDSSGSTPIPEWYLAHNPFADRPLPGGIFPFAIEYAWSFGKEKVFLPTHTVSDILDLPDPWPGEEH